MMGPDAQRAEKKNRRPAGGLTFVSEALGYSIQPREKVSEWNRQTESSENPHNTCEMIPVVK